MYSDDMTLKQAWFTVRNLRPYVSPNNGFMRQLIALEKALYGTTSVNEDDFKDDVG